MKIENFIALRFIVNSRNNKDIASASFTAITVIAVAIIFFIISVSIMNGYIYGIMRLGIEVKSSHIDIKSDNTHKEAEEIAAKLSSLAEIKYIGVYRETKALISANSKTTGIIYFRSIPEDGFARDSDLGQCIRIIDGKKSILKNEILISEKTSEKLKLKTGDYLFLISYVSKDSPKITLNRLKVSGIFTTGYVEMDEELSYIGESTGERILGNELPYYISIKLKDYKKAEMLTRVLKYSGYKEVDNWLDSNYNEFTALKFEKNVIAFIVIIALFVAVLNILTTIYIIINEKKKDIGILKAIGCPPGNMSIIFILYSIYIGFIGTFAGIFSGLLIMNRLNSILSFISDIVNFILETNHNIISRFIETEPLAKFEIFSKDFYLDRIYTDISITEITLIAFLAFSFSIIAAAIPAMSGNKIKPIEVIKNG